jgi:hypothetical protein
VSIDPSKLLSRGVRESIGSFDLVLLAGQFVGARFVREFARHPSDTVCPPRPDPVNGG